MYKIYKKVLATQTKQTTHNKCFTKGQKTRENSKSNPFWKS